MKLISRSLIMASILSLQTVKAMPTKYMILFSGTPSEDYKTLLNKSLSQTLPEWEELSKFEKGNPGCKRRKKYLIQFCLKGDKLTLVHQNEKALKRTISKLMDMHKSGEIKDESEILKAFQ